ncbi:MAG: hypothetical protein KGP14_01575 [Betaproteobacteria bacterium]|nr:hypothetical protein [Betaproteobacteria bacterium]
MQVRQLQIAHDALQDRLVLRVATQADEEFRVWLTRRFLRELWPHLARSLAQASSSMPLVADAEAMPAPPSFEQAFQDDKATYPLGSTPLLTSEIKVDTLSDGGYHLTFREGRERSFELGLTPDLLQAFCAMLRAAAEQAQWSLALDYAAQEPSAPSPGTPHSRLH